MVTMFEFEKPILYKAVIHTLNKYQAVPTFSTFEIDREEEMTYDFLLKHINFLYHSREMKWARFQEDSVVDCMMTDLDQNLDAFMEVTKDISSLLHQVIYENSSTLPSCDLAFVLFEMSELLYFGCFKWNHKRFFVRGKEPTKDGNIWKLSNTEDLYLANRTKVDEGFLIHLKHKDIALIDRKYIINSDEVQLLGDMVLKSDAGFSEKEKFQEFKEITTNLEDKFVGEDFSQKAQVKKAVLDSVFEKGSVHIPTVIEQAFEEKSELKNIYENAFQKANLWNEEIVIPETTLKKNYQKQHIITDEGIEVNIPVHLVNETDTVEFVLEENGKWSIVIKNIDMMKEK